MLLATVIDDTALLRFYIHHQFWLKNTFSSL